MLSEHEYIKQYHKMNTKQLALLDQLCIDCSHRDGNLIPIYRHLLSQRRSTPCNILYYHGDQLIGFLSIFFFYLDACEIIVMVSPAHRKKGVATRMLKHADSILKSHPVKTLIFPSPSGLNDTWLTKKGFYYQISEFEMQRIEQDPISLGHCSLTIRDATVNDIPTLCDMDSACFPKQSPFPSLRFQELLQDPHYKVLIAIKEGIPIGKAHMAERQDKIIFTDIAVLPDYQGRGYGSYLLGYCINLCLASQHQTMSLNVETTNQQALALYFRQGFKVTNAYDYWATSEHYLISP